MLTMESTTTTETVDADASTDTGTQAGVSPQGDTSGPADTGTADAGTADMGAADAVTADTETADTGTVYMGTGGTGTGYTGTADAGTVYTGTADAGTMYTGAMYTETADTGTTDTETTDTETADTETADTGTTDTGPADPGSTASAGQQAQPSAAPLGPAEAAEPERRRIVGPQILGSILIVAVCLVAAIWYVPKIITADGQSFTGTVSSNGVTNLNFASPGLVGKVSVQLGQVGEDRTGTRDRDVPGHHRLAQR